MVVQQHENQRNAIFVAVSLLLHTVLILLLPNFVGSPTPSLNGGGTTLVTIVQASVNQPVQATRSIPAVAKTPESKLRPVARSLPSPVKNVKLIAKPIVNSNRSVGTVQKTSPKQADSSVRVLTNNRGPEINPVRPATAPEKAISQGAPVLPTKTVESVVEKAPEPLPELPTSSEVVSGFGLRPTYPAKEAASIGGTVVVKIVVTVSAKGTPSGRTVGTSGNSDLDRWMRMWAERRLQYIHLPDTYEVVVEAVVNPEAKSANFRLYSASDRVRIVQH